MKEEDAFLLLCTLVEKIVPDHYSKTLVGSVVDQQVFTHLVKLFMPQLTTHMETKYMELATFTVPWFVCLFLNTISLKMNAVILDAFFLDGPKFLFWFGLAIVKLNEKILLTKRDDDLFMNVFKGYFERLTILAEDIPENQIQHTQTVSDEMFLKMTGKPLMQYTLWIAYSQFAPHVTNELVDSLRVKFMLTVVHQMESTYQKSQIRNICETVKLSYEEVEIVYKEIRRLEFLREEFNPQSVQHLEYANNTIAYLQKKGGWGNLKSKSKVKIEPDAKKSIPLQEFKQVFSKVSPWRSDFTAILPTNRPLVSGLSFRRASVQPTPTIKKSFPEDHQIPISDRLYYYTAFHRSKSHENASLVDTLTLDLGNMVQLLDSLTKQPLKTKFRLLFDIHDLDGDGFLNKNELKATMDSLLELFDGAQKKFGSTCQNDEVYLKAVSNFLGTALKSGKTIFGKGDKGEEMNSEKNKSRSFSENGVLCGEDGFKLGFHEFLLSVLSQSVFVDFFERVWKLENDSSGGILLKSSK